MENDKESKINLYVKELISNIIDKEGGFKSKSICYFHVRIEKINENYYLSKISLNGIQPKSYSYKMNISGFDVYIYSYKKIKEKKKLDEAAFFVPDSRNWDFLLHVNKEEILSKKLLVNYSDYFIIPY